MKLNEAINQWRQAEGAENVLVLLGDDGTQPGLRRVALAWQNVPVKVLHDEFAPEGADEWEAAWRCVEIDRERLSAIAGVSMNVCTRYVETLRGHRLIYPDGTLAGTAQKALRQLARTALGL